MLQAILKLASTAILCACLSGCYLLQAARGQMDVMSRRQPIAKLIENPKTPDKLRGRLEYVAEARDFASRELGLPENRSYRSYADVERRFVVWNVFVTPRFSITPLRWCFPIAGCIVYRGYFHEEAAERYARRMRLGGRDATVGGVSGYSTLGHFDDPVLNTMMEWGDADLAGTIFHELGHQVLYVKDDSDFNEAFATVIEDAGLMRWLEHRHDAARLKVWKAARVKSLEFTNLLLATRERLRALYRLKLSEDEMAARKDAEFGRLKFEYELLKERWSGYSGYDGWFDRPLGNADLVPISTYQRCVPGLQRLLDEQGGDLPKFYEAARTLAKESREVRHAKLCAGGDEKE